MWKRAIAVLGLLIVVFIYAYFIGPYPIGFTGKIAPEIYAIDDGKFSGQIRAKEASLGATVTLKAKLHRVNPFLKQPVEVTLLVTKPNGEQFTITDHIYWGLKFDGGPYYPGTYFHIEGEKLDQEGTYTLSSASSGSFKVKPGSFNVAKGVTGEQIPQLLIREDVGKYRFQVFSYEGLSPAHSFSSQNRAFP